MVHAIDRRRHKEYERMVKCFARSIKNMTKGNEEIECRRRENMAKSRFFIVGEGTEVELSHRPCPIV